MGCRLSVGTKTTDPPVTARPDQPADAEQMTGELSDTDLQHIVGGLARTWMDDAAVQDVPDLVLIDRR